MNEDDSQFVLKIDKTRFSPQTFQNNNNNNAIDEHYCAKTDSSINYNIKIRDSQVLNEEPFLNIKTDNNGSILQDSFFLLGEGKNYKICRVEILPKEKVPFHKHFHKNEFIYVLNGAGIIFNESQPSNLLVNDFISIPKLCLHSIENQGVINLVLLEIQSGEYLGDDDISVKEDNILP